MTTITENYVSFETAKLLKEKRFNGEIHAWYNYFGTSTVEFDLGEAPDAMTPAPTLQMAMKYLREVHNLFIQICILPHTTITIEQKYYFFTIHKDRRTLAFRKDFPSEYYFTYEEACEAAIKYCLEHLI